MWCPTAVGIWHGGDFVAVSRCGAAVPSTATPTFVAESMAPPFFTFSTFLKVEYVLYLGLIWAFLGRPRRSVAQAAGMIGGVDSPLSREVQKASWGRDKRNQHVVIDSRIPVICRIYSDFL